MVEVQEIDIASFPVGEEKTIPRFKDEFSIPVYIDDFKSGRTLFFVSPYRHNNKVVALDNFGKTIALVGQKSCGQLYIDTYRRMLTASYVTAIKSILRVA